MAVFDRARPRVSWLAFGLLSVMLASITFYGVGLYGRAQALAQLEESGRSEAGLKVALLRAVLERPRSLPLLLSLDRDVGDALKAPGTAVNEALSLKLERLAAGTAVSVLYVIDRNGMTISASNWRGPQSFVGSDYSFREYFSGALANGEAEHFALGTVSRHPGLYISHRVGPASDPLGVVVVKMEFDQLERDWQATGRPALVVDPDHVVLITSIPSWRFMTTEPLAPERQMAIRDSLQFGEAPLMPLPLSRIQDRGSGVMILRGVLPGDGAQDYLSITLPVTSTAWEFHYLLPVAEPVAAAIREARLIASLVLGGLLLLGAVWLRRRQLALMTMANAERAREELELRVVERTVDLSHARDRLQAEIVDHRATEARLQAVQQDLVQANRLAILGQVAAGVAHEINQPVATIRAYAENARVYLDRQQTGPVGDNLLQISGLTERIGAITDDLKALARKGRAEAEPVMLQEVFDGASMLLRSRFTGRLEILQIAPPPRGLKVMGNRLRLEQVFINLFQNALEALESRDDAKVSVTTVVDEDQVTVTVADNGPGIAPEILAQLFQPFNSSKEKGLGLGLVISKDIVSDYDGHIAVESGAEGSRFILRLRKAKP